jgi:hypothetical protein
MRADRKERAMQANGLSNPVLRPHARQVTSAIAALVLIFGTVGFLGSSTADAQVQRSQLTLLLVDASQRANVVTLTCNPDGGTHPHPARACSSLRDAGGDFKRLPPDSTTACTFVYQPVQAYATGHWRGRPVAFTHTYGNRCSAGVESGHVFDF